VNLLAGGVFLNGRYSMMLIMLHFSEQLIGVGFSFNAFFMIATLFQIALRSGVWAWILPATTTDAF
jgi:hypothetical protein